MDAIDNPSYFSLLSDLPSEFRNALSSRKWTDGAKPTSQTLPSSSARRAFGASQARRNFRSLKRTQSADTHLLVLGKPRPSDLPQTDYTTSYQRRSSVGNVNAKTVNTEDMVLCDGPLVESGDNDVFLSDNRNIQYHNPATSFTNRTGPSGRRRHSIGSFLQKGRPIIGISNNENRNQPDASSRRKFKRISLENIGNSMTEDDLDILLVFCGESEVATMWVDYLISCFQRISAERKKSYFKLQNVKLEDLLIQAPSSIGMKCPGARLQIVIVCPSFLEKIRIASSQENPLVKILHPDNVLALMLGVQEDNDTLLKIEFPYYEHWRKMNVKDRDSTSVGDFLGVSMDILSRTWQMQEIIRSKRQQTCFSIVPKKVKVGHDKLIVLFNEPLLPEDSMKILIEKNGQRMEVASVKRRNPYTLQFTMPGNCLDVSMLVSVHVEKNGKSLGKRMVKCESSMQELEQLLKLLDNPISFLCQSFGLNAYDKEQLDSFLLSTFLKNVPANFNLLKPCIPVNKSFTCVEEFPTLLHLAAKYGLEKLTCQLMESRGGEQACQIRDNSHLTPIEIAQKGNHTRLANALKGHMQMTELSSMYNYLQGMTTENLRSKNDRTTFVRQHAENNYLVPRPVSDTYLIPPTARPIDLHKLPASVNATEMSFFLPSYENFRPDNAAPWATTASTPFATSNPYLPGGLENYEMPSNERPCTQQTPSSPLSSAERKFEGYLDMNPRNDSSNFGSLSRMERRRSISTLSETNSFSKDGCSRLLSNGEKLSTDDELLEIINDFKNNVFTIKEVEKLVQEWQNRSDVQQSYREKQKQLNTMREEYDRIQRKMKEEMKRPTPFERLRKFFRRGKIKQCENSKRISISSDAAGSRIRTRTNSSLHSLSSEYSDVNSIREGSNCTINSHTDRPINNTLLPETIDTRKHNLYSEIPQPPKCLDLSVNFDFTDYVQPDCTTCKNRNRLSGCSGSVLNHTIHEYFELNHLETYPSWGEKNENATVYRFTKKEKKSNGNGKTNSLKIESKRKTPENVKSKVRSAENLMYDREYPNLLYDKFYQNENSDHTGSTVGSAKRQKNEFSAIKAFGAGTIKSSCDTKHVENIVEESDGLTAEINFEFNKPTNRSSKGSERRSLNISRKSSSLDLSSLSSNSNCLADENGEMKNVLSLELKITQEAETESETVPFAMITHPQNYLNIYKLPEYVNVNMKNSSTLPRRCKFVTVSS